MKLEDYFEINGTYELKDGLYNVDGHVQLYKKVNKLPFKFGKVTGHFYCFDNKLTSLEGSPKSIGGNFYCSSNNLTSLKGCPKQVGGTFSCSKNNLTSLKGAPTHVGGTFYCHENKLTSLKGCPLYIGDDFLCDIELHNTKEYKQHLILKKLKK
jgi:hypothetical protein